MDVSEIGPVMARNAGLVEMLRASVARSAASGYSEAMVENVDAATAPMPSTQASSGMRSRRRLSLIKAPVPVSRSRVARLVAGALLTAMVAVIVPPPSDDGRTAWPALILGRDRCPASGSTCSP